MLHYNLKANTYLISIIFVNDSTSTNLIRLHFTFVCTSDFSEIKIEKTQEEHNQIPIVDHFKNAFKKITRENLYHTVFFSIAE